jgi:hypothetical protein
MTSLNESILAQYDLSTDVLSDVLNDEVGFINESRTVVRLNQPSQFVGTLAGEKYPAELTFRAGNLTSLTLIKRVRPEDGRVVYTARGAMTNVKFDIAIKDGNESVDLIDQMLSLTNASIAKSGKVYSREDFLKNISNKNMRFAPINDTPEAKDSYRGMSLFFEQQGTSEEQFELAASKFQELGGYRVEGSQRVVSQYKHDTGLPVLGFEMNRQDRSRNRAGTGFVDLLDSTMGSLLNYFKFAGLLKATEKQIASATGKNVETLNAQREAIVKEMNIFTRSLGNWGGVQPGITIQPDGTVTNNGEWYVTNVPCGRVQLGSSDSPVELDFWTNRGTSMTTASVIDTTASTDGSLEEDPF